MNLLRNATFAAVIDGRPDHWQIWSPRPSLAPLLEVNGGTVALAGNGRPSVFGKLGQVVPAEPGQWYRVEVSFEPNDLPDVTRCSLFNLVFRDGDRLVREVLIDEVEGQGDRLIVRKTAQCPPGADGAEVEIFLRHATSGRLVLHGASLCRTEAPPASRTARVAAVKQYPCPPSTAESNRAVYATMLDRAGHAGVDLCCLPEATNLVATGLSAQEAAEPIVGPSFLAYAAKAREYAMWVVACYNTMESDLCRNTAVLIDRTGELAGVYHKTHLHWPELRDGVTPGDEYPVFQTDFGTIGLMICYDSWFPEVARLLAYKGAEAICFPVWGYDETVLRGRAVDNNTYIVAASLGSAAAIISSNGDLIAHTASSGVVTAEIAIEARPTYAYGDRALTNGIPGASRWTRDTVSLREYEELPQQILEI